MSNKNLYLIGTYHSDLEGHRRLEGLLREISPDIIALEFHKDREDSINSKKSLEEEEKETDEDLREVGLSLTPEQRRTLLEFGRIMRSTIGYELRTSKDYIQTNPKSRLEYIDIPLFENDAQEFIDRYKILLKEMLRKTSQSSELRNSFLETLNKGIEKYIQVLREESKEMYQNTAMVERIVNLSKDPETFKNLRESWPENAVQVIEKMCNPQRDETMVNRIKELYNNGSHKLVAITGLLHLPGLKSRILDLSPTTMTLANYDTKILL